MDVTATATWEVRVDASFDSPASSVAVVSAPGVITPVAPGTIAIDVLHFSYGGSSPNHTFAVGPSRTAVPLCPYISGTVTDENGTAIVGALVEILEGPDAGRSTTVSVLPTTYHFDHIRMGVAFTMRISKPGYETKLQVHPAIEDDQSGYPGPKFLDFRLSKAN
jgi:hypothetical protein